MGLTRRQLFMIGGGTTIGLAVAALARERVLAPKGDRPNPTLTDSLGSQKADGGDSSLLAKQGIFAPPRGDVRILVISDLNGPYGTTEYEPEVHRMVELLPGWHPDLVLCAGDMVAGQHPPLTVDQMKAMWAGFEKTVAGPLRQGQYPYGFTLGNHDASNVRGPSGEELFAEERAQAAAYWQDTAHDPGLNFVDKTGFPFYYTFLHKDIFFLSWDASGAVIAPEQIAWADESLASSVAQQAKLRLVVGHLPLYPVTVDRDYPGEFLNRTEDLQALMERHNVYAYITGHDHGYYPAHRGKLQLLHCGILGSGPRPYLTGSLKPFKTLTVMDVSFQEPGSPKVVYTTYDMATLTPVDEKVLPKLIVGPNGAVLRRDIEWDVLTPAEQATPYIPSY